MTDEQSEALQQLMKDVQFLRDRQEILDCINLYGRGLDRLDIDLISDAYHKDAVDNHGPYTGYVPEFAKFAIEIEGSFLGTHHGISSHNCEIDGDSAHAESYVHWFVKLEDGKTVAAGGGRYLDRLERRDGKWKISLRRLLMDWTFTVPSDSWLGEEWDSVVGNRDKTDPSYMRPLELPEDLIKILAEKDKP